MTDAALKAVLSLCENRATIGAGNPALHGVNMTDQPVEPPSGPIDPNNPPPPPPTKPKGSPREEANQEDIGTDQPEGSTAPASSNEASDE